jgi:hypothetical protein
MGYLMTLYQLQQLFSVRWSEWVTKLANLKGIQKKQLWPVST